MSDALELWTVYKTPLDYPKHYVARKFLVTATDPRATAEVIIRDDLESLRDELWKRGLTCLPAESADEPQIVESWI